MKKSLFDYTYGKTKELLEMAKMPFIKSKIQKKLEAAIGDAEIKKLDATDNYEKALMNKGDLDIEGLIQLKREVAQCDEVIGEIQGIKKDLFEPRDWEEVEEK